MTSLYLFRYWRGPFKHSLHIQYIPRNMHTVFALLCFVVVIHWLIFPYPPGLLRWHCGNLTIAPVPAKQPWWIWMNTSCEITMNDYITTTKQSTTKPCAYLLGYTVKDCCVESWILLLVHAPLSTTKVSVFLFKYTGHRLPREETVLGIPHTQKGVTYGMCWITFSVDRFLLKHVYTYCHLGNGGNTLRPRRKLALITIWPCYFYDTTAWYHIF